MREKSNTIITYKDLLTSMADMPKTKCSLTVNEELTVLPVLQLILISLPLTSKTSPSIQATSGSSTQTCEPTATLNFLACKGNLSTLGLEQMALFQCIRKNDPTKLLKILREKIIKTNSEYLRIHYFWLIID